MNKPRLYFVGCSCHGCPNFTRLSKSEKWTCEACSSRRCAHSRASASGVIVSSSKPERQIQPDEVEWGSGL